MPKGWCPEYFYFNPNLEAEKSLESIWSEIQNYSGEFFIDDIEFFRRQTDFMVPLPPLFYEGKFLKGMFLSQGVDYIYSIFPRINELFFSMAYTMWSSLPYSSCADVYLSCYNYPEREDWFKKTYPEKQNKIFIPLQDADFTNEYQVAPTFATPKDIDVLCIARLAKVKNLNMLLDALMHYHKKYKKRLKAVLITGKNKKDYDESDKAILNELETLAGGKTELRKYLKILGKVPYGENINRYYTRSKMLVLTSIYEGKNRAINEANMCNTPVVVFKDLSKYTRGLDKAFVSGGGVYVPEYSAEALCDSLYYTINNLDKFSPRKGYLTENGRLNFLNKCIDSIPYYKENIPDYVPGRIQDNIWLDLAMQANYQLSLNAFLYGNNTAIQQTKLNEYNTYIMDFYNERFMISGGEKVLPERGNKEA